MNRTAYLVVASILLIPRILPAADSNQLDSNLNLYTVLAALNAAGYDAGLDSPLYRATPSAESPNVAPLRLEVRKAIEAKKIPVLEQLKAVYQKHKPRHSEADDFSQYVSLALSLSGAPDFAWKGRQVDMPPDAIALDDFRMLLPDFYHQANIESLWQRSQPALEHMMEVYHGPISRMALEVSAYFRAPLAGYLGRNFRIYVDALGPPNYIQGRSYGDDYFVIVTPSAEPRMQDIRRAFLRFTVDPIGTKYGLDLMQKRSLLDIAVAAPALPDIYKTDFVLLATECLIKAVEARLDRNPQAVTTALEQGYILTPYFFEQLPVYEKQPEAMRLYFTTLIDGINLQRETVRLQDVKFAGAPTSRVAKPPIASSMPPPKPAGSTTPSGKLVSQAEDLYDNKDYDKAKAAFLKSLEAAGTGGDHARAYYGLARIAALQRNPELSERLFQKTLESSPEPQVKAWSLVYLGKLSDAADDRPAARKYFEEALSVEGISQKAHEEAEKGLKQLPKP